MVDCIILRIMIKNLVINNIALIDRLDINFERGLTVLSGETGSGKSIIIDSLAFVLGDRADKTLIKYGEEIAEVTALFEVASDCPVLEKLKENGYGDDCEILLNRKMSVSGKNEIRINGKTSTLALLKEICSELVDIFGQGQHLSLLNENNQLSVLDAFCNFNGIDTELKSVWANRLSVINKELKSYGGSEAERERLLDILKYQIDEIKAANLDEQEEEQLLSAHKRMVNAEKISNALKFSIEVLNGEMGAVEKISQSVGYLRPIVSIESEAEELISRLQSARLEIDDITVNLDGIFSSVEFSSAEVDRVEERLEKIRILKRKYGGSVSEVLKFLSEAEIKYENLKNSAERIEELNRQKYDIICKMYELAVKKSNIRKETALDLSERIMSELSDLGMDGTRFEIYFNDDVTLEGYAEAPSADGIDKVRFLMSANVGEPLKPLSKVISGGEMSRFMLAVKNITALAEKIPTMVFDEIDTGISGNMAQMVANKLACVSRDKNYGYQSIVITHLPQICAMADVNLFIEKHEHNGKTLTNVRVLESFEQRAEEVARLMGSVGKHAIVNAGELIEWSNAYKNGIGG